MKDLRFKEYHLFLWGIFTIVLIFFFIGVLVNSEVKYGTGFIQDVMDGLESEDIYTYFLRAENHYFYQPQENEKDLFSISHISKILLTLGTNVVPEDARTFLGRELPGLTLYDTKIVIAGEGTNLATLPYESSPPTEVLLKEREIVEEKIKGREEDKTSSEEPKEVKDKNNPVYIYQTHSWESFLPLLKNAKVPNDAISNDQRVNVIALGSRLSNKLMEEGIAVKHDQTNMTKELLKRKWSTTKSYKLSGDIIQASVNDTQDLEYYIDIHRDSARKKMTTKTINGKEYAKLYFVVGEANKNYEQNLKFVEKIHNEIEKRYPGLSRGVFLKPKSLGNGEYNQGISDKAILIEIGGVDNDFDELDRSVDIFSEVFSDIYWQERQAKEVNGDG